jgi:two-component system sensor kinase FixL
MALVSVADTGPGISQDIADRLFQPFITTKPTGMGVGLSISRTIIEAHGGRIWVEAVDGGGAVFRFTVERADQEGVSDGD